MPRLACRTRGSGASTPRTCRCDAACLCRVQMKHTAPVADPQPLLPPLRPFPALHSGQDGFHQVWAPRAVAAAVEAAVARTQAAQVVTFDAGGISGHPNHVATHAGVLHWWAARKTGGAETQLWLLVRNRGFVDDSALHSDPNSLVSVRRARRWPPNSQARCWRPWPCSARLRGVGGGGELPCVWRPPGAPQPGPWPAMSPRRYGTAHCSSPSPAARTTTPCTG